MWFGSTSRTAHEETVRGLDTLDNTLRLCPNHHVLLVDCDIHDGAVVSSGRSRWARNQITPTMGKSSDDVGKGIAGLLFFVLFLIAVIPKEVWIFLGLLAGAAIVLGVIVWGLQACEKHRAAAQARAKAERAAQAAAAKREREEKARRQKQHRIDTLGGKNAGLVEWALAAVQRVVSSEAARTGWLGDVDFTADIQGITDKLQKAHGLQKIADKLAALDKPSADDRKILAEAKTTIANLEVAAIGRVELIEKCALEARRVDDSLRTEREDARTAEQRAELHAELSAMLYGIEATPDTASRDSAADAVMARVQAYREIKNQIQQTRDS
ncbi:hypothetical protein [Mycolicibacterium sp. XJ1819]